MAVAISRVTPAVVQRLQVPVQVLLYAGLFIFSQYLVSWLHLPLPANLVGMVLMLALIVCGLFRLAGYAQAHAGCWRRCCYSLFPPSWR